MQLLCEHGECIDGNLLPVSAFYIYIRHDERLINHNLRSLLGE
jgi:hypothetical protein